MLTFLSVLFTLTACEPAEPGACLLAAANEGCPECYDGDVSCSYEDIVVTEPSCGGCQAANALYTALCVAGSEASEEEILADMVCVDIDEPE